MRLDGFSGSSNPAELAFVGDRLDLDALLFMPRRKIERTDSDFASTSKNCFFLLPEVGDAQRIDERISLGLTLYGNGGLNTNYRDDTGQSDTDANPARCGDAPGNFFFGCGQLGFDLAQVILAPTLSWQYHPGAEHRDLAPARLPADQGIQAAGFRGSIVCAGFGQQSRLRQRGQSRCPDRLVHPATAVAGCRRSLCHTHLHAGIRQIPWSAGGSWQFRFSGQSQRRYRDPAGERLVIRSGWAPNFFR